MQLQQGQDQSLEEYVQDYKNLLQTVYKGEHSEFAFHYFLQGLAQPTIRDNILAKRANGQRVAVDCLQ